MLSRICLLSALMVLFIAPLSGQERTKTRTPGSQSSGSATLGSGNRPAARPAVGRTIGSRPTAPPSVSTPSSPAGGTVGMPGGSFSSFGRFPSSDWYRFNSFLERLYRSYRFLPFDYYLWRYEQGDSPITPDVARLALQDSVETSGILIDAAEHLDLLIQRFEAGQVSHDDFEEYVESMSDRIRDLAKDVRKDDMVDYLDLNRDQDSPSYDRVRTVSELRELTHRLRERASQMNQNLTALYEEDMTRVVDVSYLERPSVDSLSKEIDRLAKTIEKSARDM